MQRLGWISTQTGNAPSERRQNRQGNVGMVTPSEETQQLLLSPLLNLSCQQMPCFHRWGLVAGWGAASLRHAGAWQVQAIPTQEAQYQLCRRFLGSWEPWLQEAVGTRSSAFRLSSGTMSWCGQVLKGGSCHYIEWEESNPARVSGILGEGFQGQMNALFLNASQGLAGAGGRPLAAGQF